MTLHKSFNIGSADVLLDNLRLGSRSEVKRMFIKSGEASERVIFSDLVTKINKRGREQKRALLISNKAVYNMKPNDFAKCKRRIAIENILSVTVSQASDEFVVHVPDEYDYRFKSLKKQDIAKVINNEHRVLTGKKIPVHHIGETVLKYLTVTKDVAKLLTRDDVMRRKHKLANEDHESDHEEHEGQLFETTQILPSKEKVSLDNFELLQVIGRGSFGKVMLVRKKDSRKIYAMKILKKSALIARNQVEHTKSERKILQDLAHPFLMALRFAFQTSQKLYFVLDYYKGGELFFHLKHKRRFREPEARLMVAEVGLALGHLHKNDIVYRDLKPENVLMDERGFLCLTDFGLSKDIKPRQEAHTFCGTPEYLGRLHHMNRSANPSQRASTAPEIVRGDGHGQAVDWWSLGILLYELTIGIPPYYSQNVHEMYQKIQTGVLRFPPFLSDNCKDLIVRLLNRNPLERLGSGGNDFDEIRAHPFFESIDWDALMRKDVEPLYVPKVKDHDADTSNFDSQFTSEPVVDSYVQDSQIINGFVNFTFQGDCPLPSE